MDIKQQIANQIQIDGISPQQIAAMLTVPPKPEMGDFALPCFSFAKIQKKSPQIIAKELAEALRDNLVIQKAEELSGYLNIFVNRQFYAQNILPNLCLQDFYKQNLGRGQKVCVEYSSANLAKFLHIGHYNCTILGECIARMYEHFGYNVVRINYIGDYGTPFGKMVVAYLLWGDEEQIKQHGVDAIQSLYVKFNQQEDENLLAMARAASKKIEDKIGQEYEIYKWFIQISKQKTEQIISSLGVKFDDWLGESYYNDKMQNVMDELQNAGLLQVSQGAKIIDMTDKNLGICVIERSDGASLYITRDLAAVEDRYQKYNFDKLVYVTAVQQDSHFEKLFAICKMLNKPYSDKLQHVSYGMFSTPEGKIASRKGKQAVLEEILQQATDKALAILDDRGFEDDEKLQIAQEVAKGAMAFSIFKVETTKDKVFDLQSAISFDGETAPYVQYTYARIQSVIKKTTATIDSIGTQVFEDDLAFEILKEINELKQSIRQSFENNEPSIMARKILNICALFNQYYNKTKIIGSQNEGQKIALLQNVAKAIKTVLNLLCINVLEKL